MSTGSLKVMIGTPCYGGIVTNGFVHSLLDTQRACDKRGIALELMLLSGESLITRGRNTIVGYMLGNPDFTHLFFIDADTGWRSEQVLRMLDFDRDVVCGVCPAKVMDWERIRANAARGVEDLEASSLIYILRGSKPGVAAEQIRSVQGFARTDYAGTGFMLIKRQVLERLRDAHPELECGMSGGMGSVTLSKPRSTYALFDCEIDPETKIYYGEDYGFCRRWRALGGEIWVDLTSRLDHIGSLTFHGDFKTQIETARPKP
ncbi:MAG TPA: hypothetical protein VHA10_00565 [Hypericibacter adhaerens]|jgi:hypothetical protein|uniref:hypothetical protein n=1 Tax=Hypericibacter adhaerens TaxID=2602016 RepID=UPI002B569ABE|nr:hypothetical protein [Hypericibacter adhaerens]HWA41673.1 hypothetical protein [Hypericibacter adhaerens]